MKQHLSVLILLLLCSSCIENTIDSQQINEQHSPKTLRSILTKTTDTNTEDSLTIMSRLQSDVDNLMMGRVILKDSIFILALKREDALFLGISEDVYDKYLDYVDRLNEQINIE